MSLDERFAETHIIADSDETLFEENIHHIALSEAGFLQILLRVPSLLRVGATRARERLQSHETKEGAHTDYDATVRKKVAGLNGFPVSVYEEKVIGSMHLNPAFVYVIDAARADLARRGKQQDTFNVLVVTRSCETILDRLLDTPLDDHPNAPLLEDGARGYSFAELLEGFTPLNRERIRLRDMESISNRDILRAHGIDVVVAGNYFTRDDGHFSGGVELGPVAKQLFDYFKRNGREIPHELISEGSKQIIYQSGTNGRPLPVLGDHEERKAFARILPVLNLQRPSQMDLQAAVTNIVVRQLNTLYR